MGKAGDSTVDVGQFGGLRGEEVDEDVMLLTRNRLKVAVESMENGENNESHEA